MSDYGTMQARIADEIARSDLSSQIEKSIQSAIKHYGRQRFWFTEATITFSTVASQEYYGSSDGVPNFSTIDSLRATVSGSYVTLIPRTFNYIDEVASSSTLTGSPSEYALYKESIRFYPKPNAIYTITMAYIARLSSLSLSGDTNAWMTDGEELIRTRAKWDLFANVLRSYDDAVAMKEMEKIALSGLVCETTAKTATGTITPSE